MRVIGGRVYPVRHYPIAIRLRDREGRAILCIALYPRTGESSGAILGVRSVALLHTQSYKIKASGGERRAEIFYPKIEQNCRKLGKIIFYYLTTIKVNLVVN